MRIEDYEIHDSIRIQTLVANHRRDHLSIMDCRAVWLEVSEDMDCGWLIMPKSDYDMLRYYDEHVARKAGKGG